MARNDDDTNDKTVKADTPKSQSRAPRRAAQKDSAAAKDAATTAKAPRKTAAKAAPKSTAKTTPPVSADKGAEAKKPAKPAGRPTTSRAASSRARSTDRADPRPTGHKAAPKPAADARAVETRAVAVDPSAKSDAPKVQTTAVDAVADPVDGPAALTGRIAENIERIESLSQRLVHALATRPIHPPAVEAPSVDFFGQAMSGWMKLASAQPARMIEQQVRFWGDTLRQMAEAQVAFRQNFAAPSQPGEDDRDRRFKNPLWRSNPFFHYIKSQYRINADALRRAASELPVEGETQRRRVDWFVNQLIDMMAPTNFLATNPEALERAIETEGESLVKGLENLVRDIESAKGEMLVGLCDRDAFQVGRNIATTPGSVVHRTPLYELIQYKPTTEEVHETPLIVFPPWINKFYILDLKPENSLLRWVVSQGYTMFVVSWKNPTEEMRDIGMGDYVAAYLDAMDQVRRICGSKQVNAIGYCIAGTTLSLTLGLLKQRGDDRVKSATFFTTLTDFSDQGEFTAYLQDDFVGGIAAEVERAGYLSTHLMQRTFSFLRANDLVWGPAIRSYMLGETPPAFDLLYWNGDGTNLPGRMVMEYLRGLCQANALAKDGFEVMGKTVHLNDVTVPLYAVACEKDHIAPWDHCWGGVAQMASDDRTFILSESGHIAGIVNPPGKDKYGHYSSDAPLEGTAKDWLAGATRHAGSWWPRWGEWLSTHSGGMVPARHPKDEIVPAPGLYVEEKA